MRADDAVTPEVPAESTEVVVPPEEPAAEVTPESPVVESTQGTDTDPTLVEETCSGCYDCQLPKVGQSLQIMLEMNYRWPHQ